MNINLIVVDSRFKCNFELILIIGLEAHRIQLERQITALNFLIQIITNNFQATSLLDIVSNLCQHPELSTHAIDHVKGLKYWKLDISN